MKLRIGQDSKCFWVEQLRWYGKWEKCRSCIEDNFKRWRNIRFLATVYEFKDLKEATGYARQWWLAYSFANRKFRKNPNKTTYYEIDIKKVNTMYLLKEGT